MVVVATTLVREARSKRVAGVTSESRSPLLATAARSGAPAPESKSPPCLCKERRDKDGAPAGFSSYVKWPNDFRATNWLACVTAIEAAGKARWAIASRSTEKAEEKRSS